MAHPREAHANKPQPTTRVELHIDEATKEVFGRVVNSETGEAVREIPAKALRVLEAQAQASIGGRIDKIV